MALTHILYDLAALPEYIAPLRDELKTVLSETEGVFARNTLVRLKKLDSFITESQRYNLPGFNTCLTFYGLHWYLNADSALSLADSKRKILRGVTLSDGTYLPAGTTIEVPSNAIHMDASVIHKSEKFR